MNTTTPSASQLQKTTELYNGIIDSVVNSVRPDFYDEGLDDQVLNELKQLWISKLSESGVLSLEPSRPIIPQQQQQQSSSRQPEQNYPGHPSQRPRMENQYVESQSSRSMAFARMQQQRLQNQQKNNSQQYQNSQNIQQSSSSQNTTSSSQQQTYYHVDGQFNLSDSDSEEDKKSSSSSSSSESEVDDDKKSTSSESAKSSTGDVEEIALNSNDDISEDDSVSFENTTNVIHCQYEHVKRKQAAKWTIKLTNGIMNLEGKDYSFSKCAGEADW